MDCVVRLPALVCNSYTVFSRVDQIDKLLQISEPGDTVDIVFDEVIQHYSYAYTKYDLRDFPSLDVEILANDSHQNASKGFYGLLAQKLFKFQESTNFETTEIPLDELVAAGIVSFEDYPDQQDTAEDAFLRVEQKFLGSEQKEFELSTVEDFDINKLRIVIYNYDILGAVVQVVGPITYDGAEVEMEIEDSGLDSYQIGIRAYNYSREKQEHVCVSKLADKNLSEFGALERLVAIVESPLFE